MTILWNLRFVIEEVLVVWYIKSPHQACKLKFDTLPFADITTNLFELEYHLVSSVLWIQACFERVEVQELLY